MQSEGPLQAIKFDEKRNKLSILNQILVPYVTSYINIESIEDAFQAIRSMQVRGAPAIAIVGAFSVVVEMDKMLDSVNERHKPEALREILRSVDYLIDARPTAINLSNACNEIKEIIIDGSNECKAFGEIFEAVRGYALKLYGEDLRNNLRMGEIGLHSVIGTLEAQNFEGPFSIMTICNTGSLATSGHGTALGLIRTIAEKLNKKSGKNFWFEHVYPCETRPYNQGARLTTYELKHENIPFTLICDNMVASLIARNKLDSKYPPVKFIITGADRIVANGDTANKIGTFQLAAIASFFNADAEKNSDKIEFIVAAPKTTFNLETPSGDLIEIEERPPQEMTTLKGPVLDDGYLNEKKTIGIATPGINVWNPAFDVTPFSLIDSIITEDTAFKKENGKFELRTIVK